MRNNDLNVHIFQNRNPRFSPKSDRRFFSTLTLRKKGKKNMGVRGYFLKKRKPCMQHLTKERKQPPVVILQQSVFDIMFIQCL